MLGLNGDAYIPTFEGDPDKLYLTKPQIAGAVIELGDMIVDRQNDGGNVDVVAGAARGALELMCVYGHRLGLAKGAIQSLGISARDDEGNIIDPEITQIPKKKYIKGKDVLWPDDVKDSGLTETIAEGILMDDLGANSFTSVALGYKPENDETNRPPALYVFTTNKWIVFPPEREPEYQSAYAELVRQGAPPEYFEKLKANYLLAQGIDPIAAALPSNL